MKTARALLLSLLLALVAGEIVLRLAGFRYELKAQVIQFQAPNRARVLDHYTLDPDFLWVRNNYLETLARALDRLPDIAFLGDSCTEFGDYDRRFLRRLAEAGVPAARLPRIANFGCAGWSTFQGRRQLERDMVRVRPKVVTIWYGWNDHWDSVGLDDAGIHRLSREPIQRLKGLRLVQFVTRSRVALAGLGRKEPRPRVPPADYEANLRAMVRTARAAGIVPVLLTAPTPGRPGEGRWTGDLVRLIAAHAALVDITRRVAAEEGAPLCDLAAAFDRIPRDEQRATLFLKDEIHLTDAGNEMVAGLLADWFRAGGPLRF